MDFPAKKINNRSSLTKFKFIVLARIISGIQFCEGSKGGFCDSGMRDAFAKRARGKKRKQDYFFENTDQNQNFPRSRIMWKIEVV